MIEKVTNITSKIELMPYGSYGNQGRNNNQEQNKKEDKFDLFTKDESKSNPFDTEQNGQNNKIQEYFNQRLAKINADIKDVILRIQKNSKYVNLIDSAIIDSQALVARYQYNKTLPLEEGKNFKFSTDKGYSSIEVFDVENNPLLKVDFVKNSIVKIKVYFETCYFDIFLRKESFLSRILGNSKTQIEKYQKKDRLSSNILEEVIYASDGQIEKYLSYHEGKVQSEILFDLSIAQFRPDQKDKLVPLKYSLYDVKNEHKLENLIYTYSLPNRYQQYNNTTGKIIKSFILQGLKSKVVKYAFFNSINGQMTACGSL